MTKKPAAKKKAAAPRPECPRAWAHRPGAYCKTCDTVPKKAAD